MRIRIRNCVIVSKDVLLKDSTLVIDGSKIASIEKSVPRGWTAPIIDAKGCYVSPGFIDSHIHGSPGDIFRNEAKYGTTAIVPTFFCHALDRLYERADRVRGFIKKDFLGRNVLGIRMEGPYINEKRAGAQDRAHIRHPDAGELLDVIKKSAPLLRIMAIAPEMKGAAGLIRILKENSIIASIGHSDASYEEAVAGIDAGITHATHIFNGMSQIDRRSPGAAGAALLSDKVTAEIVLDFVHVHKALFDLLFKVKGRDRVILITDSIKACLSDGTEKKSGVYKFKNGTIAGSSLTMIKAVRNAVNVCGISLVDAVRLASLNPARLLGVETGKGSIEPGKDADVVIFDKDFDVKMTLVCGDIVYRKKGF